MTRKSRFSQLFLLFEFGVVIFGVLMMSTIPKIPLTDSKQKSQVKTPVTSDFWGGHEETEFVEIDYTGADIHMGDVIFHKSLINPGVYEAKVKCYIDIVWPEENTLWQINLPFAFGDASNYLIRRSPIDVYYCKDDMEHPTGPTYIGYKTYWMISGTPSIPDRLEFTLSLPEVGFYQDRSIGNSTKVQKYFISISRTSSPRSYFNTTFHGEITLPFDKITTPPEFWNLTGTEIDYVNMTDQYQFNYEWKTSSTIKSYLSFSFSLGDIYNGSDYLFSITFLRLKEPPFFGSNLFGDVILPLIIGFIGGMPLPLLYFFIRNIPYNSRVMDARKFLKYHILPSLAMGAVGILWSYLVFIGSH